jgi:predicted RNA-binding protein with PUA-like domain
MLVDLRGESALPEPVTLTRIRATPALAQMDLLRRGNRLSIQPVTASEWQTITKLGGL